MFKKPKSDFRIIGYVFTLITFIFLTIGCIIIYNKRKFLNNSISIYGTVIDVIYERSKDSDGHTSTSLYPVIEYYDENNNKIIWKSNFTENSAMMIGEKIALRYEIGNPKSVNIDTFMGLWFGAVMMGIFSVFFGGFAIAFLLLKD
jgi:hypothetical protein